VGSGASRKRKVADARYNSQGSPKQEGDIGSNVRCRSPFAGKDKEARLGRKCEGRIMTDRDLLLVLARNKVLGVFLEIG